MYVFQLKNGKVVDVSPQELARFQEDNPDALYLHGGEGGITQQFVVDHGDSVKVHTVNQWNYEDFIEEHGVGNIKTKDQYFGELKKQQEAKRKAAQDPFTLKTWDGFVNWWNIDPDETQETNSWSETLFGKNQLTDFFADITRAAGRGWKQGSDITELGLLFKVKDRKLTASEEKELFEAIKRQGEIGQSDEMLDYMGSRTLSSNGTWNSMDALSGMSPTLMFETFTSSALSMFRGAFEKEGLAWGMVGAGAGAATGAGTAALAGQLGPQAAAPEELITVPVGAVLGAVGGLFSGVGGALEATGKIGELIREEMAEKGLDFTYENFQQFVKDNPETLVDIRQKAITKGVTIAAVDTLFSAVALPGIGAAAGRTTQFGRMMSRPLVRTGVAFTTEGISGAGGEYLSQKFIGEASDPKELMLEATGGGPVTAITAVNQILNPPKYFIDGEKVTRADIWERLSDPNVTDTDVVKSNIEIKNDPALQNELKARENAVAKLSGLPRDKRKFVDNPNFDPNKPEGLDNLKQIKNENYNQHLISREDRELILDLENALEEAESKKAVLVEIDGVLKNVQDLKQQIKDIYSGYEGQTSMDLRLGDVKTAVDVQKSLMEKQEKIGEQQTKAGLIFKAFDFTDQFIDAYNQKKSEKDVSITYEGPEGVKFSDGTIMIDRQKSVEVKAYDRVGSHELFHNIVDSKFDALTGDKKKSLISDFKKLLKSRLDNKTYNAIVKRLKENKEDLDTSVEWFTYFSDQYADRNKHYGERKKGLFKRLLPFLQKNIRENTDYKNFEFGDVKNMFDFLKNYANDVKAGRNIDYVQPLIDVGGATQESRSKVVDAVNKMEQGAKTQAEFRSPGIFNDIYNSITQDGGAINNYVKSLGLSKEKFQETIDSLSDRLMNYDPATKRKTGTGEPITIGEFLMANIGFAKLDAAKKLAIEAKKEGKTKRIDAAKKTKEGETTFDIEDTETLTQEMLDEQDMSIEGIAKREAKEAKRKETVYSKLRQTLGIETGSELYNRVLDASKKALIRAYEAGKPVRQIQRDLKDAANTYIFKEVKNMLGVGKNYIPNIKKLRESIVESMFVADLVQMERNIPDNEKVFTRFVKNLTSKQEVQDAVDKNLLPLSALNTIDKRQSVSLYEKVMPTENEFVGFFDQPLVTAKGIRSGLKGTRKDQLAKYLANSLSLDAMLQVAQDLEVIQKRQDFAELRGETIAEHDLQILASTIGRDINVKFSKSNAVTDINNAIDNGTNTDVYSQVRFSKSHRTQYERRLEKNRTDLSEEQRKNAVQSIFDFVDKNDIPNNKKAKLEKLALHYMANGYLILPEDGYKVIEAERVATIKKLDAFSYKNPNVLLEENVVKKKVKRTNPDDLDTFTNKTEYSDGVVVYDVEDSKDGQLAVRKVIDTHFGKKANPWCLCARQAPGAYIETDESYSLEGAEQIAKTHQDLGRRTNIETYTNPDGTKVWEIYVYEKGQTATELDNAFLQWKNYNQDGEGLGFKIAFHNGELIAFRDGKKSPRWWDRMDKPSEAPTIKGKKGKDGYRTVSLAYRNKTIPQYLEKVTGDNKNGTTIKKDLDGTVTNIESKKDGAKHGKQFQRNNDRSAYYIQEMYEVYDKGNRTSFKEVRIYKDYKGESGKESFSNGRDELTLNNITKYERSYTHPVLGPTPDSANIKDYTETTIVEGTIDQKYFKEFNDPSSAEGFVKTNLKYTTPAYERYYSRQGEKVTLVVKKGETKSVTINGEVQETRARFSRSAANDVKFSLTQLQQDRKTLPAILRKQLEVEQRILDNPTVEDIYLLESLSDLELAIKNETSYEEAFAVFKETLPQDVSSLLVDFKDINSFANYIKNVSVPVIRTLGFKAAKTYFKNKFDSLKTTEEKVDLTANFLKNIGISVRAGKGLEVSFTNQQLLDGPITEIFGKKFVSKHFKTASITENGKKGKTITYSYDGKSGSFEKVPLYKDIDAVKDSRGKSDVVAEVNKEASEAREFVDEIIDSDLSVSEKLAIIDLLSLNQRGAVRKMYMFGETVTSKAKISNKDLVLEHEITVKNMTTYLRQRVKGILNESQLNEIIDQAKVHVWPKQIDTILNEQKLRQEGGRSRYQNVKVRKYLQGLANKELITNVPNRLKEINNLKKSVKFSRSTKKPTKGISILDFDDTLATSSSLIRFTRPDGTKGTLTPEQYASTYQDLLGLGYEFDFSEFNKVIDGKPAPLLNKAKKLAGKFGTNNMFILTARPPESAPAIHKFLKENGLNIPLKNITGLGNSTAEAKALWVLEKTAEGYNDFYFADDAIQNVKAVKDLLSQVDVKSKVQQAKVKFSKSLNKDFNNILERVTGIESQKVFSAAQAKLRGRKFKLRGLVPPSAQDFLGLIYNFLPKGKEGDKAMNFFKKALIDPFARAINELNMSRQQAVENYSKLLKKFPKVKKKLKKKLNKFKNTPDHVQDYTVDQAVRVYLWNKAGFEVPGLSKRDLKALVEFVENDTEIQNFADIVGAISGKEQGYAKPGDHWLVENIKSDLFSDGAIGDVRADFLAEWKENVDEIFSPENLNKIEVIYGYKFVEALKDMLYRMETGNNRPTGSNRLTNMYMNWVNNSVGAIMFFNIRSAVLQTISSINYINWTDNNPLKAGLALANQKQYWKDFVYLFNSDFLKQRRTGNQRGVNESELMNAVIGSDNPIKAALAWLLNKGFLPTQIADSFAIASGGATFYRNRVKTYIKQGVSKVDAEKQAFIDFQETTEVAQQSARPDLISQQQANPLGRLILAFQNTPMQYGRIMNKAVRDLVNRRGDAKTHISKLIYYGAVQAIIFNALQSAIWAALKDEDEEEFDKKKKRIVNGMIDGWLATFGYGGKAFGAVKNAITEYYKQEEKDWGADHMYTMMQLLSFSPPIGSKLRKIYSAIQTEKFNKGVSEKRGFTLDNPTWSLYGNLIEGVTNIPLGRLSQKMLNLDNAMDSHNEWWQRVALVMGWNTWDLGVKDKDIQRVKEEIKEERKIEKKKEDDIKREEKKKKEDEENKVKENENKKKSKKDGICAAISRSGNRCKKKVEPGTTYCTIHAKVEQGTKEVQCKKIKSNKERCKMKTKAKSGYCYYHD